MLGPLSGCVVAFFFFFFSLSSFGLVSVLTIVSQHPSVTVISLCNVTSRFLISSIFMHKISFLCFSIQNLFSHHFWSLFLTHTPLQSLPSRCWSLALLLMRRSLLRRVFLSGTRIYISLWCDVSASSPISTVWLWNGWRGTLLPLVSFALSAFVNAPSGVIWITNSSEFCSRTQM